MARIPWPWKYNVTKGTFVITQQMIWIARYYAMLVINKRTRRSDVLLEILIRFVLFVFCGAAAQCGPWSPHSWGFLITHNDASQSVGLLWTSDKLVAETSTWQHITLTTDKHPCPRWDSNPRSQQASSLRPRGYWDRLLIRYILIYIPHILWNPEVPVAKLQICCGEYFKHAVLKVTRLLILCIIWQNLVDVCWYPRINNLAQMLNGRNSVCILAAVVYWCRENNPVKTDGDFTWIFQHKAEKKRENKPICKNLVVSRVKPTTPAGRRRHYKGTEAHPWPAVDPRGQHTYKI